jgi:predicted enzyme related to lactoylglutathione lyase
LSRTSRARPRAARSAFEVEDLDALIRDLKSKGTTFLGDIVHGPNCRMTTCLDTEGNSIILHQLNPKS